MLMMSWRRHRPWSDGFPDLTSPFPSLPSVAHRWCKSDEGTDHLLDSSFVSICQVWIIPSSDLVLPVKTVHGKKEGETEKEKKKTQFIMCVYTFSYFGSCMLDHIAWGFLFLFFVLPDVTHTHTHCARSDDFDKSTKKTSQPYPGFWSIHLETFLSDQFHFLGPFYFSIFLFWLEAQEQ